VVADIGSTLTKLSAFAALETDHPQFLGQGVSLTSIDDGDVGIGLERARTDLADRCGVESTGAEFMAASSAAGGLRMTVHGLTRDMTLKAAREASLGAGAIIAFTTAGKIQPVDLQRVETIAPNIILLAGGVDYGDREIVLYNAGVLAAAGIQAPTIYAGNLAVREEARKILERAGIKVFVVDNVYPRIDELNIDPVRRVIQAVFSEHIVTAPGMEKVKKIADGEVVPTPAAVLKSAELLFEAMGDLVVVDVGGATSDVHSVTEGSVKYAKMMIGPEPRSKRTVEGDLGICGNAPHIIQAAGGALDPVQKVVALPQQAEAIENSTTLARWAVDLSVWRHAGEIRMDYGAYGRHEIAEGRDLTCVKTIIGTGGALTRLGSGKKILGALRRDPSGRKLLPPPGTPILLDSHYIMAAAGVLSRRFPDAALQLLKQSIEV
jgi:uncharacterized protein (TIGR01319 family)